MVGYLNFYYTKYTISTTFTAPHYPLEWGSLVVIHEIVAIAQK